LDRQNNQPNPISRHLQAQVTRQDLSTVSSQRANSWQSYLTDFYGMGDLYSKKQHLFYMILVY